MNRPTRRWPKNSLVFFSSSSIRELSRLCRRFLAAAMCNEVSAISQGDTCTLISDKTRDNDLNRRVVLDRKGTVLIGRQQAPRTEETTTRTIFSKVEQIFERRDFVFLCSSCLSERYSLLQIRQLNSTHHGSYQSCTSKC